MKIKREEIDNFLIELDKFIEKNKAVLTLEEVFELMLPFKVAIPSTFWPKNDIPLSTILPYINKQARSRYWDTYKKNRTSNYLRRAAYKTEFRSIKWQDYIEMFWRVLEKMWNEEFKRSWLKLINFFNTYWQDLIIPTEWDEISNDMIYMDKYEIV